MHGNVWQWCEDLYDPKASGEGASYRVYRGGSWDGDAGDCRAADRRGLRPVGRDFSLGFRLVRVPVEGKADPPKPKDGPLGMKFVHLPKGTFYMGWDSKDKKSTKTEIKEDFEIGVYTVTQEQWEKLMGNNPSDYSRAGSGKDFVKDIKDEDLKQFPVESVSWDDAQKFIEKLNEQEKGKGWKYRLPTEAEWEYACRGGATSEEECSYDFYLGKPTNDLSSKEANFNGNEPAGKGDKGPFLRRPTKVGSYAPNKLGLYDMHGNVSQWCEDHPKASGAGAAYRVFRGGAWDWDAAYCRAGYRYGGVPRDRNDFFLGLRLARVPVKQDGK
jgi:formylglycine-generating enzyme required for sulfatase activity